MRLIKMNAQQFKDEGGVERFFSAIGGCTPPGRFRFPKGRISAEKLRDGERILFSFDQAVRYVAIASSGRQTNQDPQTKKKYPYFFTIDPKSIRSMNVSYEELNRRANRIGAKIEHDGQRWNPIIDTPETNALFADLEREGNPI